MSFTEITEGVHLLKIVGGVITAAMIGLTSWMALTLNDVSIRMAVLESQVTTLVLEDSRVNPAENRAEIKLLENKIDNLSKRVSDVERDLRGR